MASYFTTSIASGQWFYVTDATPAATISAPRGSLAIRTDVGNESVWINVTAGAAPGTDWERILSPNLNGDLDLTGVDQITLLDNAAVALDIGSTGLLNLLRFITTNGAETVQYRGALPFNIVTGGLSVTAGPVTLPQASVSVPLAANAMADKGMGSVLEVRIDFPNTINTDTDATLPARTAGYRIVDAHVISGGAGGNVQVQTGGGATIVTNMGLGAAGAVARATNIVPNTTYAGGSVVRVRSDGGITTAGTCYVRFEPL
jgi:hypothetical protein